MPQVTTQRDQPHKGAFDCGRPKRGRIGSSQSPGGQQGFRETRFRYRSPAPLLPPKSPTYIPPIHRSFHDAILGETSLGKLQRSAATSITSSRAHFWKKCLWPRPRGSTGRRSAGKGRATRHAVPHRTHTESPCLVILVTVSDSESGENQSIQLSGCAACPTMLATPMHELRNS